MKKKNVPKKRFFLPFFYATFQCGRYNVLVFLPTKSWKNRPQKLLIIGPNLLFHSTAHSPELIFHIIKCREQASVLFSVIMTIFIIISCQRFLPLLHSMHGGRFSLKQSARQKQLCQIWTNAYHLSSQLEGSYHFNLTDISRYLT
jgi:hypothetical protein